jgi:hypothetical protein
MIPPRETIMLALLAQAIQPPAIVSFTANTASGSAQLANVSAGAQLALGMPVFGPGIVRGTVIADPVAQTLSLPATATASGVSLLQGFQTTGRRLKKANEIAAQPALFINDGAEDHPERPSGLPDKIILEAQLWIYANGGQNPDAVPATQLNALIDAVEAALAPTPVFAGSFPQNVQTLGGLVQHCWIEGKLEKYSGWTNGQAIAVVPVRMLVPQ